MNDIMTEAQEGINNIKFGLKYLIFTGVGFALFYPK
jgi:hypothetical protein